MEIYFLTSTNFTLSMLLNYDFFKTPKAFEICKMKLVPNSSLSYRHNEPLPFPKVQLKQLLCT